MLYKGHLYLDKILHQYTPSQQIKFATRTLSVMEYSQKYLSPVMIPAALIIVHPGPVFAAIAKSGHLSHLGITFEVGHVKNLP